MNIYNTITNESVSCSILKLYKDNFPKKKDGWKFNWGTALKESPNSTFGLFENEYMTIQGALQIKYDDRMLIMEIIELAPWNVGKQRKFKNVAGCLIAYACREAIKLKSNYKGYVTFISKTELIEWYKQKYFATQAIGQRMYIDPISGEKLIKKYL